MPPRTRLNASASFFFVFITTVSTTYYSRTFKTDTEGAIKSVGINGVALFRSGRVKVKKTLLFNQILNND